MCRELCYFRAEVSDRRRSFIQSKVTTVKRSDELGVHENEQLRNDVNSVNRTSQMARSDCILASRCPDCSQ